MPEALKQVLNYGFYVKKLNFIVCSHFVNNNQSRRVIEKCDFKYIRTGNGKIYYRLNKSDL